VSELFQRARDGRLLPTTLVWRAGMTGWLPAGEVEELRTAFPASPPPLPPGT
jgi:hypothetical protein